MIRVFTRVVPLLAPMDFEAFLRVHFSKVGEQTLQSIELWIVEGTARGLPTGALTALAGALREARH